MRNFLVYVWLPFLAACSSMEVKTGRDPQADLSNYHTYSWRTPSPSIGALRPRPQLEQTILSSVENELAKKGLKQVKTGDADLVVSYLAAAGNEVQYDPGPGPMAGPGFYGYTYMYRQGSLTLQLTDTKTGKVVWQGTASDVVPDSGAKPEQVAEAVKEIVRDYPQV